jgi:hypothetical protein
MQRWRMVPFRLVELKFLFPLQCACNVRAKRYLDAGLVDLVSLSVPISQRANILSVTGIRDSLASCGYISLPTCENVPNARHVCILSLSPCREEQKIHLLASWVHKVPGDRSERVLTMSSWYQVTPKRKEKLGKDRANLQRKALTKAQLEKFCRASRLRNAVMMVTTTRGSALNITTLSRIAAAIPSMSTTRSMSA